MNRKDLQALAESRLRDAQLLFGSRRFDAAYYLAGYVIECGLKACIAKRTKRHDFPDRKIAERAYTHDLTQLLSVAGIADALQQEFHNDRTLDVRWGVVKDWNEKSRYESHGRRKAKDMLEAVAGRQGVCECIKRYW